MVRDTSKFSFTFLIGNILILVTILTVVYNCSRVLREQGVNQTITPFNSTGYLSTAGYCVYMFEGIGVVMPLMEICEEPKKFPKILMACIATLAILYISFGGICYMTYGDNL